MCAERAKFSVDLFNNTAIHCDKLKQKQQSNLMNPMHEHGYYTPDNFNTFPIIY